MDRIISKGARGGSVDQRRARPLVPLWNWSDIAGKYWLKLDTGNTNFNAQIDAGLGGSSATWNTIKSELQESSKFAGVQVGVPWGLYETGVSGGNFSRLSYLVDIADELQAIGKYLILNLMEFREFRNNNVADLPIVEQMAYILPEDLRTHSGLAPGMTAARQHYLWDYAFGYEKAAASNFGYDLKVYDAALRARMLTFYQAVADLLGSHPAFVAIDGTESVVGTALYTGAGGYYAPDGASERNTLDGKTAIITAVNNMFPNQIVMSCVNFPNSNTGIDYCGEYYGAVNTNKLAITAPNCNWWVPILNRATGAKGALRYFPILAGSCPVFVQWQGDEFDSDTGATGKAPPITTTADITQRYADLYQRSTAGDGSARYGLFANGVIIQRSQPQPFWLGGTTSGMPNTPDGVTIPSLKNYIKNNAVPLITTQPGYIT